MFLLVEPLSLVSIKEALSRRIDLLAKSSEEDRSSGGLARRTLRTPRRASSTDISFLVGGAMLSVRP